MKVTVDKRKLLHRSLFTIKIYGLFLAGLAGTDATIHVPPQLLACLLQMPVDKWREREREREMPT